MQASHILFAISQGLVTRPAQDCSNFPSLMVMIDVPAIFSFWVRRFTAGASTILPRKHRVESLCRHAIFLFKMFFSPANVFSFRFFLPVCRAFQFVTWFAISGLAIEVRRWFPLLAIGAKPPFCRNDNATIFVPSGRAPIITLRVATEYASEISTTLTESSGFWMPRIAFGAHEHPTFLAVVIRFLSFKDRKIGQPLNLAATSTHLVHKPAC